MVRKTTAPRAFCSGVLPTTLLQNAVANGPPLSTALQEGYLITRIILLNNTTGKLSKTHIIPDDPQFHWSSSVHHPVHRRNRDGRNGLGILDDAAGRHPFLNF